jgi:hypothetical protein
VADATIWRDAVVLSRRAAKAFGLRHAARLHVEPLPYHPGTLLDGDCQPDRGVIRLRLWRLNRPRRSLSRAMIFATLVHELAHLRWPDHDERHGELTRQLAAWFREQGQPVAHRLHSSSYRPLEKVTARIAWKGGRRRAHREAKRRRRIA